MILYNKTILLPPTLQALYNLLQNNDDESLYSCKCIYSDRIACKHYICGVQQNHIIQIWKTKSLFDYWFDGFGSRNFIACINYTIHDTYIKIVHLGIEKSLDEYDAEDIVKCLVNFVKLVAIQENKTKIVLDVHQNLRIFLKYYYYIGFTPILLEDEKYKKCTDNPYWIETELIL